MTLYPLKIEAAIKECGTHVRRIHFVIGKLDDVFPLTVEAFEKLPDETITFLDQFLYRFMKLQDTMGTRFFPALAALVSGSDEPRPFVDTLNILEKNRVIDSAEQWQQLRNIRNSAAHEYPDSSDQTVDALNALFSQWMFLEQMFISAEEYYSSRLSGIK